MQVRRRKDGATVTAKSKWDRAQLVAAVLVGFDYGSETVREVQRAVEKGGEITLTLDELGVHNVASGAATFSPSLAEQLR